MLSMLTSALLMVVIGADGPFNFNTVEPNPTDGDQRVPDIWTLSLNYRSPRFIMVEIPGKGRRLVWYMRYYIINNSGKPRQVIPKFTLVTDKGDVFEDIILPSAQKAVVMREDPTRPLHNSVTIAKDNVPVTPTEGHPLEVHGIAFWEGGEKLMNAKSFEIFVTGLSNGYVKVEGDGKTATEPEMLRKTLRLPFTKPGDIFNPDAKEIRISGSPSWIYR
ncbi:hypothetical protein K2X85_15785 [bacterium]|jgi:hypothetical protein|nr:hypothetical protein [bacterium]